MLNFSWVIPLAESVIQPEVSTTEEDLERKSFDHQLVNTRGGLGKKIYGKIEKKYIYIFTFIQYIYIYLFIKYYIYIKYIYFLHT